MKPVTHRASRCARILALLSAASLPTWVMAHAGGDGAHHHSALEAMVSGFTHPFTGLDHLAAMVALGVWSALTARRMWVAPLAFAATLLVGALLGLDGVALPAIEPMIATSLLAVGLLLATGLPLPAMVGAVMAGGFALFHGSAHGLELAGDFSGAAVAGMVVATAVLHLLGMAIGMGMKRSTPWLPRVAGTAVALFGLVLLMPLR